MTEADGSAPVLLDDESLDSAFGGAVRVVQPKKGYRFSVEALLLARFAANFRGARVVDLGCGSGVVGMGVLGLLPASSLVGVELQQVYVDRAIRSAKLNGFEGRAAFKCVDVRGVESVLRSGCADLVVANPPFRSPLSSRVSSDESLALARNEMAGTLADFSKAAQYLLSPGGFFCVVYPAYRLDYLLSSVNAEALTTVALRFIHPRAGEKATFVLIGAHKGRKGQLEVLSPLFLHEEKESGEKYSPEARSLIGPEGF